MDASKGWRGVALGLMGRVDATFQRLYGWRGNPLHQSGTLAVLAFVVLLVTGIYLLLFYRIGGPWASVERIAAQPWGGAWMRSVHRYASDVALVAVAVHALRMFLQGRSWGRRSLAWISGVVLTGVVLVCGWTGFVMVWDTHAQVLAVEGGRILDVLPIFSEPLARTFVGERPMPAAFFFLNLFLHIALPIGVALLLWVHVSRVARPALLPPRPLVWGTLGALGLTALLWPAPLGPEADLFLRPRDVPLDVLYGFFLPLTPSLPPWAVWLGGCVVTAGVCAVPLLTRPRAAARPEPSVVDERLCTGCEQCFVDCPYEAISMVDRSDDRPGLVALVDPDICVSCGICAGSCAPMGVGPPGRTGRDQLGDVKRFIRAREPGPRDVVLVACDRGSGGLGGMAAFAGAPVLAVRCAGSLHTSVVEYLVRSGAGGVLVVSCPPRDCWNREGATWLEQRLFHDREAELQARVDRRRVRLLFAGAGERTAVARALATFQEEVARLAVEGEGDDIVLDTECVVQAGDDGPSGAGS